MTSTHMVLVFPLAIAVGFILPVQSAMNTRLKVSVGTTLAASFVAYALGTIFLGAFVAAGRMPVLPGADAPWWSYTSGALGVLALVTVILIFPKVGAVETVVLPVAGKIVSGLLIDHFGWFNSPVQPISVWRVLGGCLAGAGMIIAFYARGRGSAKPALVWRFLGVLVGVYAAVQAAVNGNLNKALGSSISSGLITFGTGALLLLVLMAFTWQWPKRQEPGPVWMWLGGPVGALFVAGMAGLVPKLGTGVSLMVVLIGQLLGSMTIEQFGLFGAQKTPVGIVQLAGVAVVAAGMAAYYLS